MPQAQGHAEIQLTARLDPPQLQAPEPEELTRSSSSSPGLSRKHDDEL
jgi:hypothetical protein